MKKIFLILVFSLFTNISLASEAPLENYRISLVPWIIPVLGASLIDLQLNGEKKLSTSNTFILGATLGSSKCYDCKTPGSEKDSGVNILHRYYFEVSDLKNLFVSSGLELIHAKVTSRSNSNQSWLWGPKLIGGIYNHFSFDPRCQYELGLGVLYRNKELIAKDETGRYEDYTGYRDGFRLLLHLAVAWSF